MAGDRYGGCRWAGALVERRQRTPKSLPPGTGMKSGNVPTCCWTERLPPWGSSPQKSLSPSLVAASIPPPLAHWGAPCFASSLTLSPPLPTGAHQKLIRFVLPLHSVFGAQRIGNMMGMWGDRGSLAVISWTPSEDITATRNPSHKSVPSMG